MKTGKNVYRFYTFTVLLEQCDITEEVSQPNKLIFGNYIAIFFLANLFCFHDNFLCCY